MPKIDQDDSVLWVAHSSGSFSIKSAWEAIRVKHPSQNWYGVIWLGKHVPRWSFILWLAIQERLNTTDRLVSWGLNVDNGCKLCGSGNESHSHLFFECSYSTEIWQKIKSKNGISSPACSLKEVMDWYVNHVKGKSFASLVLKCSLAAVVYHIWLERNQRIFQNKAVDSGMLGSGVIANIRAFLCSNRYVKPS